MSTSMNIITFFETYSAAIQAVVAIANLLIIGFLTIKGYLLQKKLMNAEQFYKLQEESIICLNYLNTYLSYFEKQADTNSSYLKKLFDLNTGDTTYEEMAKYSLKRFNETIKRMKDIKILLDQFNNTQINKKSDPKDIQINLKKIIHLKYLIINCNANEFFESTMYGADSHWVDEEHMFETAINGVDDLINKIEGAVKALTREL